MAELKGIELAKISIPIKAKQRRSQVMVELPCVAYREFAARKKKGIKDGQRFLFKVNFYGKNRFDQNA